MVSEKHRTDARQVLVGRRLAFAEDSGPDALIDGIAAALANAEREGMRRAAEIVYEASAHWQAVADDMKACGDAASMRFAGENHRVLHATATAILSEAGEA